MTDPNFLMALRPCIGDDWVAAVVYTVVDAHGCSPSTSCLVIYSNDPEWRYMGASAPIDLETADFEEFHDSLEQASDAETDAFLAASAAS